MSNIRDQYTAVRGSGISAFGSVLAVIFFIVTTPYLWYLAWKYRNLPTSAEYGKSWEELRAQQDETGLVKRNKND